MTKRVLITGCAGGLGKAFCSTFRAAGYSVIGTDRKSLDDDTPLDGFVQVDVANAIASEANLSAFIAEVKTHCNGQPLDVLINNAAVQHLGKTKNISLKTFRESLDVNITTPFALTKAFLPDLRATKGTVINVGSVHTRSTKPEFVAYATSKAAIDGLTRALAVDLGPDVRVVALAPAAVDTEMLRAGFEGNPDGFQALQRIHPAGRIAQPTEIGELAVFLASDKAGFMTGTTVYADGGILSRLHDPV